MLNVERVTAGYGPIEVLHDVSVSVGAGEIVALIGSNGAGKTTLLRAISGLVRVTSGRIVFEQQALNAVAPNRIVQHGVVHCPEGRMVLTRMTVRENLLLGAYLRSRDPAVSDDLDRVLQLFPRLAERLDQLAGTLSGGEQQMLAIGRSLMAKPRLLMLDEPSLGVAPLLVESIFQALAQVRRAGVTVLLVEQNAARALQLADRAYVLELGRITAEGGGQQLIGDPRVRQAYLGI